MKVQRLNFVLVALVVAILALAIPLQAQNNAMWRITGNSNVNGQFVGTTDTASLVFKTANAERMRIKGNGALRVGSLAGTQQSVVGVKADGSLFRLDVPGTDTGFTCATRLYSAAGNWLTPNCFIGSVNAAPFRIFSNNTERIRVTEFGTVGIGTSSPQTPLHFYSATNAELRVQGGAQVAQPQVSLCMGNTAQVAKLADFRAGINTSTFYPEAFIEVNDGAGLTSMKKVLRIDASKAELQARLGVGMAAPANDYMAVNGTVKLTETNNPANYLRMGHDGANAFIEHQTPTPNSNNPSRLFVNQGGGRTDFGVMVVMNAKLGIGTTNFTDAGTGKDYRLSVNGRIRCSEVKVYSGWADHVFGPDYHLMPLADVEAFIADNGHLPGLPSAAEVAQEGVDVGATQALLLEKIEELTLHLIQLQKENAELRADVNSLK